MTRAAGTTRSIDVVVVGAGVAGLSAAVAASGSGHSVAVLEKSDRIGGTARFANGSIWIPNNHLARRKGIRHDDAQERRFILSDCHAASFDTTKPRDGMDRHTYARAGRYVRWAAAVVSDLERAGVCTFTQLDWMFDAYFFSSDSVENARRALESKGHAPDAVAAERAARCTWDYHWQNPYNLVPYGKHLWASAAVRSTSRFFLKGLREHLFDIVGNLAAIRSWRSFADQIAKLPGKFWGLGHGLSLVEALGQRLVNSGIQILTNATITGIHVEGDRVLAVEVALAGGRRERWSVSRALVIASGCSSHDAEWRARRPALRSSCVVSSNTGDALRMLAGHDVRVKSGAEPLLCQSVLQLARAGRGVSHEPVFLIWGDSFFLVDRHGHRVVNEKLNYHDRSAAHLASSERELLFLIGDRRFVERSWGMAVGLPFDRRWVLKGDNPRTLASRIAEELARCGAGLTLADDFATNLAATTRAFNTYAREGRDPEFGRGDNPFDVLGFPKRDPDNDCPSRTMKPLEGHELFACIYCLATFGTTGGLECDAASRVLRGDGTPWRNLYAIGTSAASMLNGRYPSHGMNIGTGLVFGYLAGLHATGATRRLRSLREHRGRHLPQTAEVQLP